MSSKKGDHILGPMGDGVLTDEQNEAMELRTQLASLINRVENLELVRESQNKRLQKTHQTIAALEKRVQNLKRPKEGRLITAAQRKQLFERWESNFWTLIERRDNNAIELWVAPWDED